MACADLWYKRVKAVLCNAFRQYGEFVGRHPEWFIALPIVIFGSFGAGLAFLDTETDLEKIYFPKNSQALKDRQYVRDTFPDPSTQPYNAFSQSDGDKAVTLLFKSKGDQNIFESSSISEIAAVIIKVKSLNSSEKTYGDLCAKLFSRCVVDGEYALSPVFQQALSANVITYPNWNNLDLKTSVSGENVKRGKLVSATVLKFSFKLAKEDDEWKRKFVEFAADLNLKNTEVTYETSDSLSEELDKGTKGDIFLFSLTLTMCCTYASVVTAGGNPVSTRGMLAFGGMLAAGLGILGSMGLCSACGVKFVNIVGVIPFLIIGIGVDDMFLLMSSWSESLPSDEQEQNVQHVPKILGKTLATAGIGITITSVTDFLAFVIGTTSVFRSVTNFSLYAGVAVLFCYLANITLFSGCLAIHGRRVYSWRHSVTCSVTKPREVLKQEGRSACFALVCGGSPPKKERDDESICEKFPSKILPFLLEGKSVSIVIIFFFIGYLAAAIYGLTHLRQGLVLQNLLPDDSYYHRFLTLSSEYFASGIPVGFIINEKLNYEGSDGTSFLQLLLQARNDSGVDSSFERCWLSSYKNSPYFNSAAPQDFISNLQNFLANNTGFAADVVLDSSKTNIIASRCFVVSKPTDNSYENADLMVRMRGLAYDSSLSVIAFHWAFVAIEQFVAVLPATLLMVGCAVAAMTVVTFIFLPHILMVLLVLLTIVMILVGIMGFMYYWNLTLSSITMIHLVMSVGFSVDFSAHVCAAYLMSDSITRLERSKDAIRHAAAPIMNGATSTFLGILLLVVSRSYIFQSFFKIMFMVILFGVLHAVLFLPAVLSLIGPENTADIDRQPQLQHTNGVNRQGPSSNVQPDMLVSRAEQPGKQETNGVNR